MIDEDEAPPGLKQSGSRSRFIHKLSDALLVGEGAGQQPRRDVVDGDHLFVGHAGGAMTPTDPDHPGRRLRRGGDDAAFVEGSDPRLAADEDGRPRPAGRCPAGASGSKRCSRDRRVPAALHVGRQLFDVQKIAFARDDIGAALPDGHRLPRSGRRSSAAGCRRANCSISAPVFGRSARNPGRRSVG